MKQVGLLDKIVLETRLGYDFIFDHSKQLLARIESDDYGLPFAMYLHYEIHMTLPDILKLTQVGCKRYRRESDDYTSKIALYHPFRKDHVVKVPRLAAASIQDQGSY